MHEVGLMQEALQIALTQARQHGAARVHAVTMRVGPLAGVEIDALRLAFEVVTSATLAEGATFRVEETPVACWCASCRSMFQPADCVFRCPQCGRLSDDIRQGRELDVVAVEIS